ncbi:MULTISPECIES: membrane-bound lytic murein transglycosylase MltC [unclassified Motilimonas]|uniref:membrane-bound lytic murein transglycosylase MltC n=1 Tax=Motilimonas TaxID=1914248 RepID=UPI00249F8CD1|nr:MULTISPECIES: membrane-bound lytic murein transglycosylase MltC [unclassified Motilimonas]MCE0558583.1 membrane-bound lytic murein transglycosylase MltC [Motilimonas sp. E26]MDO6527948.1 membrane-bound lytic murein transglycosylase MltC [Motilimonas sp. 1_MG-2023]
MNKTLLFVPALLLAACASNQQKSEQSDLEQFLAQRQDYYQKNPQSADKDVEGFESLVNHFADRVYVTWGQSDSIFASSKHYVKYTDNYQSRAQIDFDNGVITIETIAKDQPNEHLHQAIVATLLTPDDPASVDIFSAKEVDAVGGKPFLYGQVEDHEGQPIQWGWRANRFADYLLSTQVVREYRQVGEVWSVSFDLVRDHQALREYKYAQLVKKYSQKYDIDESLIYAVMKTESSFNPYAVSHANAYGLMQVVPSTAGRDVFEKIKLRDGEPSRQYLFDPENNIDIGTAYLHILKTRYLKEITDPESLRFAIISAYNGGAGNVLKTFHSDRKQAPNVINSRSSAQVYQSLTNDHPSAESRRYLYKVNKAQKAFYSGRS